MSCNKNKRVYGLLLCCWMLLFFHAAKGQLCAGSLGDPVVNITFGTGPNFGAPLSNSVTSYNNSSVACFNDGFYILASSMPSCWGDTWYALTEDHTPGDANGYMMVVNASQNPGDFYVKQVDGLCGDVTYEFAAWILNLLKPTACGSGGIRPNVTFKIETLTGTVLLTYNSGDINPTSGVVWTQYGAFFTLPAGLSSVVIRMTNNATGGCGNDLVLDDITFRPCGKLVNVRINGASLVKELCSGQPWNVALSSDAVAGSNTIYQWQTKSSTDTIWRDIPGANNLSFTPATQLLAATYYYRLSFAQTSNIGTLSCRVVSNEVSVIVHPLPTPAASSNSPLCVGDQLILAASGADTFRWTGPGGYNSNKHSDTVFNVGLSAGGVYHVVAVTSKGCSAADSISVVVNTRPKAAITTKALAICEGDSVLLQAVASNYSSLVWQPQVGLASPNGTHTMAKPVRSTTYYFIAANQNCVARDSVAVTVNILPKANAGPDKQTEEGVAVQLLGSVGGTSITYAWSPAYAISSVDALQPFVTPGKDTVYTLKVISSAGCGTAEDRVMVKVYQQINIPNAFSPNGDGVNDTWRINHLEQYPGAQLSVFNRYGAPVFVSFGRFEPWKGTYRAVPVPVGTYYYIIRLPETNRTFKGWVTILR